MFNRTFKLGVSGAIALFGINFITGGEIGNRLLGKEEVTKEDMVMVGGVCLVASILCSSFTNGIKQERTRLIQEYRDRERHY